MEQSRNRVKKLNDTSDYKYAARQYKDYSIAKEIESDLKVMVYAILGSKKDIDVQSSKTPSCFGVVGKEPKYYWFAYIKPGGYMFLAESEIELYCNIIAKIVGNRLYIPFS
ncbi:hypothetical protein [Lacrimispora sp.]|uniref:hypothetical protein n=1 Tax=Lacrimispora sp. TaxID=2719234 RepID=UPI0028A9EAC8|nr:hypothetical protein [Lacrimispora sp.]